MTVAAYSHRPWRAASLESGIPWRICETNSFSGGGLPGVSDTFLGALWTLDFMLLLASYGCSGVNIETGVNQLGFCRTWMPPESPRSIWTDFSFPSPSISVRQTPLTRNSEPI